MQFKYQLKNSWHLMGIKKGRTVWTVILLFLTSLITATMFMIQLTENNTSQEIENNITIRVNVKSNATRAQTQTLANQIASTPNVKSVKYSSKKQELDRLVKEQGSAFKVDTAVSGVPTLAVFYVRINDTNKLAKTTDQLKDLPYVDHVNGNVKMNAQTKRVLNYISYTILAIELIFLLITFFRLKRNIKFTIELRKEIIRKELSVGATHKYIKTPFVLQNILTGLMASGLSIIGIAPLYLLSYLALNNQANGTIKMLAPVQAILICWSLTILVIMIFSFLASIVSIHIKEKKQIYN